MKPAIQYALWAAGFAGAGAAAYYVFKNQLADKMELPEGVSGPQGEQGPVVQRVQHRERANGVRNELQTFLDWWNVNGPFQLIVAPDGGVRTDAAKQRRFFDLGYSKADTLFKTPHGHSSALDLWPVGFNPVLDLDKQPAIKQQFKEMGAIAKAQFNFTWGGDWGWDFPHIEVKGWKTYPMAGTTRGANLAGLSGLGTLDATSTAQWLIPTAAVGLVVYQVFIRKDEGKKTLGVRSPDPKASRLSKKFVEA